jgi:hypothetical protein
LNERMELLSKIRKNREKRVGAWLDKLDSEAKEIVAQSKTTREYKMMDRACQYVPVGAVPAEVQSKLINSFHYLFYSEGSLVS